MKALRSDESLCSVITEASLYLQSIFGDIVSKKKLLLSREKSNQITFFKIRINFLQ